MNQTSERSEHSAKRVAQNPKDFSFLEILLFAAVHPFLFCRIVKLALLSVLARRQQIRHDNQQLVSWFEDNK